MKKISLNDVLEIKQLSFYIDPKNLSFFLKKQSDFDDIVYYMNDILGDKIMTTGNYSELLFGSPQKSSDSVSTKMSSESIFESLKHNDKKINQNQLLLYLAAVAKNFLADLEKAEKNNTNVNSELAYANGDIVSIVDNKMKVVSMHNDKPSISQIKRDLAEGILIANQLLTQEANKNLAIFGTYFIPGIHSGSKRMSFSKKELDEAVKTDLVLRNIDKKRMRRDATKKTNTKTYFIKSFG